MGLHVLVALVHPYYTTNVFFSLERITTYTYHMLVKHYKQFVLKNKVGSSLLNLAT